MSKPSYFINDNGQLWKLIEGEYQLIREDLRFVPGSYVDENTASTEDGKIYLIDFDEIVEVKDKKIIQYIAHLYEEDRRYLVLTDDHYLYHIIDIPNQRRVRLLQTEVARLINHYQHDPNYLTIIQLIDEDQWMSIYYESGEYRYIDLPIPRRDVPHNDCRIMGRIVISDGDIRRVEFVDNDYLAYFDKVTIGQDIKFKVACQLIINSYSEYLIAIDIDDHLYRIHTDYRESIIEIIDNRKWSDLRLIDQRCYPVDEEGQIYHINMDISYRGLIIHSIDPVEIPPHVINGFNRFRKTKNARKS